MEKDFLAEKKFEGLTENSLRSYVDFFKLWNEWLAQESKLEHLKADIYNNIKEEGFETVTAYIMGEGFTGEMTPAQYSDYLKQFQNQEPAGEFGTFGFSACDHASVWLCLHHCSMWALLNWGAGVSCGIICGYAFSYAC
jgi:hypothetical protein